MALTTGEIGQVARTQTLDLAGAAIGTASGAGAGNTLYNAVPNDGTTKAVPAHGGPNTEAPIGFTTATSVTVQVDTAACARVRFSADGLTFGDWQQLVFAGIYTFDQLVQKVQIDQAVATPGNYVMEFFA